MAACGACGTTILFGGTKIGEDRFCDARCAQRGQLLTISRQIPPDAVRNAVSQVFHGVCPKCHGPGPVDVHTSYRVWSAVFMTQWQSLQHVSCRSCGVKAQLGDAALSLFLGWWGIPWGLIMTPVQISRNVAAALKSPSELGPSPKLESVVRISLASNAVSRPGSTA